MPKPEWSMIPIPKPTRAERPAAKAERRRAVAPVSEKRRAEQRIYGQMRAEFLRDHSRCEARLDGCGVYAAEIHHRVGRDNYRYLDAAMFLPVCSRCHRQITDMPIDEATERGLSERRNGRTG